MNRTTPFPPSSSPPNESASTLTTDDQDSFNPYPFQKTRPGSAPGEQTYPKVLDPYTGRYVSTKPANLPFLAHQRYKASQAAAAEAARTGISLKTAEDKLSKESDERAQSKGQTIQKGVLGWLKVIVWTFMASCIIGRFITGSPVWGYEDDIRSIWKKHLWKPTQIRFDLDQLSQYTGKDPDKPIYLSISGKVYDVSSSARIYGPGGSYSMLTGKDASRAFVTGCFQDHHLNHDLRGIGPAELKSLFNWESFFAKHKRYTQIGTVSLPPIDLSEPIPGPCLDSAPNPPEARRGTNSEIRVPPVSAADSNHGHGHGQGQAHGRQAGRSEHSEL